MLTVSVTQPSLKLCRNKYLEHENETDLSLLTTVAVYAAVISMLAISAMLLTNNKTGWVYTARYF